MSERERTEPNKGDERYMRRDEHGQFSEAADVGRSLAADSRQHASRESRAMKVTKGTEHSDH